MGRRGEVATIETSGGPFTLVVAEGAVVASGWTRDVGGLLAAVHPSLRPDDLATLAADAAPRGEDDVLARAVAAVRHYDAGTDPDAPARVPTRAVGGAFREAAWRAMRSIPPGEHLSYAALAARAGRPAAVRAAGGACATNPVPLFVPCHRVVRSDGSLGGFAYGLPLKRHLLEAEATWARAHPVS